MSIEAMSAELKELDRQLGDLSKRHQELRQQIADARAEFKIGDRVTYEGAKHVWQITAIGPGYGSGVRYFGSKLKKDGTAGKASHEIWAGSFAKLRLA